MRLILTSMLLREHHRLTAPKMARRPLTVYIMFHTSASCTQHAIPFKSAPPGKHPASLECFSQSPKRLSAFAEMTIGCSWTAHSCNPSSHLNGVEPRRLQVPGGTTDRRTLVWDKSCSMTGNYSIRYALGGEEACRNLRYCKSEFQGSWPECPWICI